MELNQWQLHYPFAEQASLCFEEKKKAYIAGLGRDQLEHLASPMTKSESKYQRVQDKSETIEKRLESGLESETGLEYYSPTPQCVSSRWKGMLSQCCPSPTVWVVQGTAVVDLLCVEPGHIVCLIGRIRRPTQGAGGGSSCGTLVGITICRSPT